MKRLQKLWLAGLFVLLLVLAPSFGIFVPDAFGQSSVFVRVTIEEVVANAECDMALGDAYYCDMYAIVDIGDQSFGSEDDNISNSNHIYPEDWIYEYPFRTSWGSVDVKINLYDSDVIGQEQFALTPDSNDFYDLDLTVDLVKETVTGDFYTAAQFAQYGFNAPYGGTTDCGEPLIATARGASSYPDFDAMIRFRVDVIPYPTGVLGKVLFVPFCWLGDPYDFADEVNEQLDVFYKALDLDSCMDDFDMVVLDRLTPTGELEVNSKCPTIGNISDPVCQNPMKYVKEALDQAGIKIGYYNEIVGMTDHDICGSVAGAHFGRGYYWAETTSPSIFAHEFGHLYNLTDEYSSVEVGGCYNDDLDINFLDPALGCDPHGDCCGGCTGNCDPCCAGNKNPDGGRCFMSSSTTPPYGYCDHCYDQITDPPFKRTAGFPNGAMALKCDEPNPVGSENIGEMTFTLTEDGQLNEFSFETHEGIPSFGSASSDGPFRLEMEKQGSLIFATDFERPSPFCEGAGCVQDGLPFVVYWKAIMPAGVAASDVITASFFKDGVFTSQTTANGAPPVADAGPDLTAECTGSGQALVTMDASTSYDPDGDTLQYAWSAPGITFADPTAVTTTAYFPLGTTTVTLTVKDGMMEDTDTFTVEVLDTTPPVLTAPADVTIYTCASPYIGTATAVDACGVSAATITNNAPARFLLGESTVSWTATDAAGNAITAVQKITAILGDDPSCCPAGTNIIVGTAGDDDLIGTFGDDCILGLGGNDLLNGKKGNDFLSGGAGRDTMVTDNGTDYLASGAGQDNLNAGKGEDSCFVDASDKVVHCEKLNYYP